MPDGVGWAATEIVLFLVVATLIGFAAGWILGRWHQANKIAGTNEAEIAAQRELARKAEHRLTDSNKQIDKLQLESTARQERIAELEAALASSGVVEEAAAAAGEPDKLSTAASPVGKAPSKEEGLARMAEIAERTAGGGFAADDDLKQIHGIGPKLERTLKDLGISSFRQIANFTADDIAYVTVALDAFKGRIERDDWMSSASEQHLRKYDSPA